MNSILDGHAIIPVVAIEKVEHAIPLAETLLSGGISVLEVTLRTDAAIESITKIINSVPELIVGSGTVCNEKQFKLSQDIGCKFIVSPGLTPSLLDLARESQQDFLPGISSASEIMLGLEYGFNRFKFFPAEASGGIATLKSLKGPFGNLKFCATGGIGAHNFLNYLSQDNVSAVGGSWMASPELMAANDWLKIEELVKQAVSLQSVSV
jgi:2-dehydro-3-deoxyphosphogluconate aldolase/(4S)-4-hydroxy-2-oxoglutarate aldolase